MDEGQCNEFCAWTPPGGEQGVGVFEHCVQRCLDFCVDCSQDPIIIAALSAIVTTVILWAAARCFTARSATPDFSPAAAKSYAERATTAKSLEQLQSSQGFTRWWAQRRTLDEVADGPFMRARWSALLAVHIASMAVAVAAITTLPFSLKGASLRQLYDVSSAWPPLLAVAGLIAGATLLLLQHLWERPIRSWFSGPPNAAAGTGDAARAGAGRSAGPQCGLCVSAMAGSTTLISILLLRLTLPGVDATSQGFLVLLACCTTIVAVRVL